MAAGGNNNRPGFAFFFVNADDNGPAFNGLPGARADLDYFLEIFVSKLGFEWVNHGQGMFSNITLGMWNHQRDATYNPGAHPGQCCIMCLMQAQDYTNVGSILLGISTHGEEKDGSQYVQLYDGNSLSVTEIMEEFSDTRFPQLKGKSRILVINSCKSDLSNPGIAGKAADRGVTYDMEVAGLGPVNDDVFSSTQPIQEEPEVPRRVVPLHRRHSWRSSKCQLRDFLVIYSTTPGRYSFNNSETGSWMLQSLKEVVDNHVHPVLHLLQALTKAAKIMSRKESIAMKEGVYDPHRTGLKSILCISSTLTSLQPFTIQRQGSSARSPEDLPQNVPLF